MFANVFIHYKLIEKHTEENNKNDGLFQKRIVVSFAREFRIDYVSHLYKVKYEK